MSTSQGESGLIVVEGRRLPGLDIVATSAIVIEIAGDMIGLAGSGEGILVAGIAVERGTRVAFTMAGLTLEGQMCACKREVSEVVIERGRSPGLHRVATGTIMVEVAGHMIGIGGIFEVVLMAGETILCGAHILLSMTTGAIETEMRSLPDDCRWMFKGRRQPGGGIGVVATETVETELSCSVVGVDRIRKGLLMADATLTACARELFALLIAVTSFAISHRVLAAQREAA